MDHKPWYKLNLFSYFVVLGLVVWFGYENFITKPDLNDSYMVSQVRDWIWFLQQEPPRELPYIAYRTGLPIYYRGVSSSDPVDSQRVYAVSYLRLTANLGLLFLTTASAVFICQYWERISFKRFTIRSLLLLTAIAAVLLASFKFGELRQQLFFAPIPIALLTLAWVGIKKMRAPRHKEG